MSDWTDFKKEIIIKTRRLQKRYNCVNNTEINNLIVKLQKQEGYSEINNIRREIYTLIDKHITPEIQLICCISRKTKKGVIYDTRNPQIIDNLTDKKVSEVLEQQRQCCPDERYSIEFIMEKTIMNNSQYGSCKILEKRVCTQYVLGLLENLQFHTAYEQYNRQGVAQE
jgi:hypothetical protein